MKNGVVNWRTYEFFSNPVGEKFTKASQTVPGMTLSLKDLLARYVRGDSVTTFEPVYAGDVDLPDIERMSEIERLDMAREIKQGIAEHRAKRKADTASTTAAAPSLPPDEVL